MDTGTVVIAVVAALIGSTGIAGFLTAGVQWTRSARLRRAIESHTKLIDSIGAKTPGGKALAKANQMDAIRLAAMSLLRPPQLMVTMVVTIVLIALAFILVLMILQNTAVFGIALKGNTRHLYGFYISAMVGYIIGAVFAFDFGLRVRRDRFVRAMVRTGKVSNKTIRAHDYGANRRDDIRSETLRNRAARREAAFESRELLVDSGHEALMTSSRSPPSA